MKYDSILLVSFGGPEKPEDVIPFLENVTRGRNVPRERLLEVAGHYRHFGGRSPINQQNRELVEALRALLAAEGPGLPVYWGNRNWHPLLSDTVGRMKQEGRKSALAFVTSAFSSYSGCRQYRENIEQARIAAGDGAPEIDKLRLFYNHPLFLNAVTDRARDALAQAPGARLVFTAHSIPESMAAGCSYQAQLSEAASLVAAALGQVEWDLAYQSRSGPPTQPWLDPDILDWLRGFQASGGKSAVIVPLGFVSDHLEVLYDLDIEAAQLGEQLGVQVVRAQTVGTHPDFVRMIRELVLERMEPGSLRRSLGSSGPWPDECPASCCRSPRSAAGTVRPAG